MRNKGRYRGPGSDALIICYQNGRRREIARIYVLASDRLKVRERFREMGRVGYVRAQA